MEEINRALWAATELEAAALHLLETLERARETMREVIAREREGG